MERLTPCLSEEAIGLLSTCRSEELHCSSAINTHSVGVISRALKREACKRPGSGSARFVGPIHARLFGLQPPTLPTATDRLVRLPPPLVKEELEGIKLGAGPIADRQLYNLRSFVSAHKSVAMDERNHLLVIGASTRHVSRVTWDVPTRKQKKTWIVTGGLIVTFLDSECLLKVFGEVVDVA
ncbi:hypothetical protein NDU88_005371 [Pleurodeles waltl]|uniref:Uncharacterized protein n=1 Tax=Pleurodeles waltl TaxID=8319 RepID=A0AAV7MW25_PLEWA|nr:hypothetical protein NDU88_005371 [Pleurodeles waltl]